MTRTRPEDLDWDTMSLEDILSLAIHDEFDARDYYRQAAAQASTPHTRRMFESLSAMEQGHADQLQKELEDLRMQHDLEAGMAD
jgi:rubrerythrin